MAALEAPRPRPPHAQRPPGDSARRGQWKGARADNREPRAGTGARHRAGAGTPPRAGFVRRLREAPGREASALGGGGGGGSATARQWLAERGHTPVADGIFLAFERASIASAQWADMLAGMTQVELAALVGSVKRQNALTAAVRKQRDPPTGGRAAAAAAAADQSAGESDSGSPVSDCSSVSSSSEADGSSDESDDESDGESGGAADELAAATPAASGRWTPWRHRPGAPVDLEGLYRASRSETGGAQPVPSAAGVQTLEAAWARHVALLFGLSWRVRHHGAGCSWCRPSVQQQLSEARGVDQARELFCEAMDAHGSAAGPIGAALAPTQAAEPRAAAGALDISALISRAQQRAQRAAWGVNKAETELGSLWTEIAGSLLGGSSQQLGESAADQSATQALAAQVQQVVLRPTGGRAGAEASQSI